MNDSSTLRWPNADLRAHPPRGAREELDGLVFLPRTIDKVRAKLQGTLGLYVVSPGISAYLFEWLGVSEADFEAIVATGADDRAIAAWLREKTDPQRYPSVNDRLRARGIRDSEHFAQVLPRYPILRERPELKNWFEIFDLDDAWIFDPTKSDR